MEKPKLSGSTKFFALQYNGKTYSEEINYIDDQRIMYVVMYFLNNLKEYYQNMPYDIVEFDYNIDSACSEYEKNIYFQVYQNIDKIVKKTNEILMKYKDFKDVAKNNENIVCYMDQDEVRFRSLYNKLIAKGQENIALDTYESGWDPVQRCWDEQKRHRITIEKVIDLVINKKAKKIIYTNFELFAFSLDEFHLSVFLDYLGVQYMGIDYDGCEYYQLYGPIIRSTIDGTYSKRLTCYPYYHIDWDLQYKQKSVQYVAVVQDYKMYEEKIKLDEDFKLIVLSNSRIKDVKDMFPEILFFLENIDEENVFEDALLAYVSLRYLIMGSESVKNVAKMEICRYLIMLHYTANQFLKYVAIDGLDTERELLLYGDTGWATLFPQNYKGFMKRPEINELKKSNKYLYFLFNNMTCYFEVGGPIFDSICDNLPFINFKVLSEIDELKPLKSIQYSGVKSLNEVVKNAYETFKDCKVDKSIKFLRNTFSRSVEELTDNVLFDKIPANGGEFYQNYLKERMTYTERIEKYIEKNKDWLIDFIVKMFVQKTDRFDITKSKYYKYDFVKKIEGYSYGE